MKFHAVLLIFVFDGLLVQITESVTVIGGNDPGACNQQSHGDAVLVKNLKNEEKVLICTDDKGAYEWKVTDGSNSLGEFYNPAFDCSDLIDKVENVRDGFFWLNFGRLKPRKIWCDMTTDGGGYMLLGKKNTPISWTLPSSNKTVGPYGTPHLLSFLGDVPILDFRVQVSIKENLRETKTHWSYRLKSRRPIKNLLNKSSDCDEDAGIDNIAYVKDLQTERIVNTGFRCSKFSQGYSPRSRLGWVQMNQCLTKPCPNGYAIIHGVWQHDFSGGFSYSSSQKSSGMEDLSTAFVGCHHEKCCACYGPEGGSANYCGRKCKAINGGTVTKKVFTWFWVRSNLPKRIWKKCMEYEVKGKDGELISYKFIGHSVLPIKGRCSKHFALLHDGIAVVRDSSAARKIPDIDGLLVYRKDKQELFLRSNKTWNGLLQSSKVNQKIDQLQNLIKKVNNSLYGEIMVPSTCSVANWWGSFDRAGWSTCGKNNFFITGFYRNSPRGRDPIVFLEEARCCTSIPLLSRQNGECTTANWWGSLDRNNAWSLCPSGYFLNGLYRSNSHYLHNIEEGRCCRPKTHPDRYRSCYNEYVGLAFDNKGWTSCSVPGYYIIGIYRGSGADRLNNIEYFRCCQMALGS